MEEKKYIFNLDGVNFEIIEHCQDYNERMYPIYSALASKHYHFGNYEIELLSYPLNVIKSNNEEVIDKLKTEWDNGYKDFLSDVDGVNNFSNKYSYKGQYYLILRNKEFNINDEIKDILREVTKFEELGVLNLDDRLISEIFELDQNLQSTNSIELILELLAENTDMKHYIPFIKENIKEEDLENQFFFDEYIYKLFSKKYIEMLKDVSVYKNDPYGRKGIERFLDQTLKGVYNDECKCCNI